jgi:hypothetical protein
MGDKSPKSKDKLKKQKSDEKKRKAEALASQKDVPQPNR